MHSYNDTTELTRRGISLLRWPEKHASSFHDLCEPRFCINVGFLQILCGTVLLLAEYKSIGWMMV